MAADLDPPGDTIVDEASPPPPLPPAGPAVGGLPTWARRLVIGLVLAVAFFILSIGMRSADVGEKAKDVDPVIVAQVPRPGDKALRQTQVGAQLADGYDGRLTIDGVAIPEEDMDYTIDPNSVSPKDLKKYGIRPNNRNAVYFTPGPGKAIEEFDTGTLQIVLTYFLDRRAQDSGRSISWTVSVD